MARSWPRSTLEDVFPLPKQLVGEGTLFLLEVSGDSMVDAAICNGDYVVVRQEQTAENGEIVAAMIDGEATVKTFQRKDGHVWLLPHNDAYDPIEGTRHDPRQGHRGASAASDRPSSGLLTDSVLLDQRPVEVNDRQGDEHVSSL